MILPIITYSQIILWSAFYICHATGRLICSTPRPSEPVIEISETEPAGSIIGTMEANLSIENWRAQVTWPSELRSYFQMKSEQQDSLTKLTFETTGSLDIEAIFQDLGRDSNGKFNEIVITFECTSSPTHYYKRFIRKVKVTPVDEHTPYFSPAKPFFTILETAPIKTTVADARDVVMENDISEGETGLVFSAKRYLGTGLDGHPKVLEVHKSGVIVLHRKLDFEAGDRQFHLNLSVKDAGNHEVLAAVTITIANVNDEPPYFTYKRCNLECRTNTVYLATADPQHPGSISRMFPGHLLALDVDSEFVTYRIYSGTPEGYADYISISSITGSLSLKQSLLDSPIKFFVLIIMAEDQSVYIMGHPREVSLRAYTSVMIWVWHRNVSFVNKPRVKYDESYDTEDTYIIAIIAVSMCNLIAAAFITLLAIRMMAKPTAAPHHGKKVIDRPVYKNPTQT